MKIYHLTRQIKPLVLGVYILVGNIEIMKIRVTDFDKSRDDHRVGNNIE